MNRNAMWVLGILLCSVLGCSQSEDVSVGGNADSFDVILITDIGGLGDKGFNDAGWAGCQDAKHRLSRRGIKIETHPIESREQTDYIENLNTAAERADVVVALGFLIEDAVKEVAPHYPNCSFIFIDGRIEAPNVASFVFRAQEGGFLAGVLSSYVTQTGIVGTLPGMDIPPVESFAAGYRAGVKTGNALQGKEIQVLSATIGSFNDPVKGKSSAQSLMSQRADILFQLAGLSGVGVIKAVEETSEPCYAIGVDIDQDSMAPGKVLTSVLKRMDKVVSDQIIAVHDKAFKSGAFEVGLKEEYVGLTEMKYTKHLVSEDGVKTINRAGELIVQNAIAVPKTLAEAEGFQVPVDSFTTQ